MTFHIFHWNIEAPIEGKNNIAICCLNLGSLVSKSMFFVLLFVFFLKWVFGSKPVIRSTVNASLRDFYVLFHYI